MKMKENTTSPSQSIIRSFEEGYGVKLPQSYLEFLRATNGGVPDTSLFVDVEGRERRIERFLCILDGPSADSPQGWYDVDVVISQISDRLVRDGEQVGVDIIPIAALFAGDFVCLDFRGTPDSPTVVVWDHEESDELKPHTIAVASSFTEFLGMLREPTP